jgi:hypothetical protein
MGNIIGCELNERYFQVSFYDEATQEPQTLENVMYPIDNLFRKAMRAESEEMIRVLKECLEQTLQKLQPIDRIVFTVPQLDVDVVRALKAIAGRIGIERQQVFVQEHRESFCNYMLYQPKELWQYESALFYCDRHEVKAYMLRKIRTGYGRGKDAFITVDEVASAQMEELSAVYPVLNVDRAREADVQFRQFVQGVFEKKLVSSVFLVGEGFENSWYPLSLKVLCNGRRAFLGNNLYSKGACYSAFKQFKGYEDALVYLDETKMMDQICFKIRSKGKEKWYPIVPWGIRWYEADTQCEILLENAEDIEVHVESLTGTEMRVERISLEGLPKRSNYTLRLLVKAILSSEKVCRLSFKDMGFGEFFPATDFYVEKEILLGGSNEQFNSLS